MPLCFWPIRTAGVEGCSVVREIETDYLVIGAGATGMAFADTLITESDADVVLVDRRHRPGGHWVDAYPFDRVPQHWGLAGLRLVSR